MISRNILKEVASLGMKKFRDKRREFTAEGHRLVLDLATSSLNIKAVYGLEPWIAENGKFLSGLGIQCEMVTPEEMERISQLSTPGPVLAVVTMPDISSNPPLTLPEGETLLLVLDDIRDPGNFGTILRIADWFGIGHVVASENCVDPFNPKVVQATMGSIARVSIHVTPLHHWLEQFSKSEENVVYGAVLDGQSIHQSFPFRPGALLIGNESRGISPELLPLIRQKISIPTYGHTGNGKAESLNASVATAILAAELRRIEHPVNE